MTDVIRLVPDSVRPLKVEMHASGNFDEGADLLATPRMRHAPWFWIALALAALVLIILVVVSECLTYMRALMAAHVALAWLFNVSAALLAAGVAWIVARAAWDYMHIGHLGCTDAVRAALAQDEDGDVVCAYVRTLAARYARHPRADVRAGVVELAADAVNQIVGGGVAGKLSGAAGQGLTTGVLVARLGLAARIVCRPLPLQKREARSSLRMFVSSIWDAVHGKFKAE